jgi:hypothetical protein
VSTEPSSTEVLIVIIDSIIGIMRVRRQPLGDFGRRLASRCQAAAHHFGIREEMQVVREMGQRIERVDEVVLKCWRSTARPLRWRDSSGMVAGARKCARACGPDGRLRAPAYRPHRACSASAGVGLASTV